jgi:hypothetical protein
MDVYGRPKFRLRLTWLFGLVSKEIRKGKKKPEEEKRIAKVKRKPGKGRMGASVIFKILRTKGLLWQFKRLLRDVLSHLKIRDLGADFRVGLDDPADTGLLFAIAGPATLFLSSSFSHKVRVQLAFEEGGVFEGYLHGTVRLWPIHLVASSLRFAFSLATIRVVKILVLSKWKKKK